MVYKIVDKPYRPVVSAIAHLNAGLIDEIIRENTVANPSSFTNSMIELKMNIFPLGI